MRTCKSFLMLTLLGAAVGCSQEREDSVPTVGGSEVKASKEKVNKTEMKSGLLSGIELESSQDLARVAGPVFRDSHEEFELDFTYLNGASGEFLMTEAMGGGVGAIDLDVDGFIDLFFSQGGDPAGGPYESSALSRSIDGVRFSNVTESAFMLERGYGQGVAIADFNNDGFDDVYMTCVESNFLWTNLGDGTFVNDTDSSEVNSKLWSTSAAWGDLDLDGDLDLFVCNYLQYDPLHPLPCPREDGAPAMCDPQELSPLPNAVFRNRGDGTFQESSVAMGLTGAGSKSLGVVVADLTVDGWPDVFVANDTTANFCFINQRDGSFVERANELGCAMSGGGAFQASMGTALGDYDRDGIPDLYVTHFSSDSNTLYRGIEAAGFSDATRQTGLHQPTLPHLGFGTVMVDFNLDGHEDLLVANGHIDDWSYKGDPYEMPPQCFSFNGVSWHECSEGCGPFFREKRIGRGIALADVDRDGDWDPIVVHQNSPTALLINDSGDRHWIQVRLIGLSSNRRGIGAKVTVTQAGKSVVQQLPGGTSYCSSHESLLTFGLGTSAYPVEIQIAWPLGGRQTIRDCEVDQTLVVIESSVAGYDNSPGAWTIP